MAAIAVFLAGGLAFTPGLGPISHAAAHARCDAPVAGFFGDTPEEKAAKVRIARY